MDRPPAWTGHPHETGHPHGQATRRTGHPHGQATRRTGHPHGQATRRTGHPHGQATRRTGHPHGQATRKGWPYYTTHRRMACRAIVYSRATPCGWPAPVLACPGAGLPRCWPAPVLACLLAAGLPRCWPACWRLACPGAGLLVGGWPALRRLACGGWMWAGATGLIVDGCPACWQLAWGTADLSTYHSRPKRRRHFAFLAARSRTCQRRSSSAGHQPALPQAGQSGKSS